MRMCCYIVAITCLFAGGCARLQTTAPRNYKTVEASSLGNTDAARSKHESALGLLEDCDCPAAEQCLHESLIEDVNFGPSHNTLGKLYFDQKKFYLAAWEFEYAIKTMPNRPEPLNNLGLVLEAVGQVEGAITNYHLAMQLDPDSPDHLGNYVRARYRQSGFTEELRPFLETLVLIESKPTWVEWAKLILSKNHPQANSTASINESLDGRVAVPTSLQDHSIPSVPSHSFPIESHTIPSNSGTPILNSPAPTPVQHN